MEKTESKVVLVTGASSGLGKSTAEFLFEKGYRVYGTSRNPGAADRTAWAMLPLDVGSDTSVAACMSEIRGREGRIDALVNNAGHAFVGAIEETSLDEAKAQFETNFFGAMRMMLAVLPFMRAQDSGRIVNVSSLAGAVPFPFLGVYSASKHALEAISDALSYELIGTGIRISILEPDGMRTSIAFHHPRSDHAPLAAKRHQLLAELETSTRETGNDPIIFARTVADVIESDAPPLRTTIGNLAAAIIQAHRTMPELQFRQMIAERTNLAGKPG